MKTTLYSETAQEKPKAIGAKSVKLTRSKKNTWHLLALPLLLFFAIPILALFLKTPLSEFSANLNKSQVAQAIRLSILTSLSTAAISVIFGTPVAYLLSQRNFRLYRFVDTLIDLPTVLPPSVAGIALLMAFGRKGLLGPAFTALNVTIPFTALAVIMAQTFIASPYYIKAATIGFSAVDLELKQAAALDGASHWQTFRYVTLPMSYSSMISGSVMTWSRALGEFGATIIFAGNFPGRTQTMPLAIYIGFEIDLDVALTLSIVMICFSFLTLVIVKSLLHRRADTSLSPAIED